MRWLALAESVDHVCCRYRLRAFEPILADNGVSLDIRAIPKSFLQRLSLFRSARTYDGVILQRKLLSRFDLSWLSWFSHMDKYPKNCITSVFASMKPQGIAEHLPEARDYITSINQTALDINALYII